MSEIIQKRKAILFFIVILFGALLLASTFSFFKNYFVKDIGISDPENFKRSKTIAGNASVAYPKDWFVKENEGGLAIYTVDIDKTENQSKAKTYLLLTSTKYEDNNNASINFLKGLECDLLATKIIDDLKANQGESAYTKLEAGVVKINGDKGCKTVFDNSDQNATLYNYFFINSDTLVNITIVNSDQGDKDLGEFMKVAGTLKID